MPRIRYILTLSMLALVLVGAVAGVAVWTWGYEPLAPAGVLVAQDQITPADKPWEMRATLVPLQSGLPVRSWAATAESPGVVRLCSSRPNPYCIQLLANRPGQDTPVPARFRLSPEAGFGPLWATAELFIVPRQLEIVLIDLETISSTGRYEISSANGERLAQGLAGRMPVYLADVHLKDYNRLRAELHKAGWPDGPTLAWRFTNDGRSAGKSDTISRLVRCFGRRIVVAVADDTEDNREAMGRQIKIVGWSDEIWQ